jgi:RNA polymerase-binding transcription factor DksA
MPSQYSKRTSNIYGRLFEKNGELHMDVTTFPHIRENLEEKRQALADWFAYTQAEHRQMHLGTAVESQFADHLHRIDGVIARTDEGTYGLCDVCHEYIGIQHLEMDYTASVCIDHFTEPEVRQLERELELAQSVQRALLPREIPSIPGLELAAFSRPAQFVGGDIFDFLRFVDDSYGLVVADVAGHGISAGLIMASLQTSLRTLAPIRHDPLAIVDQLLHIYQNNINLTLFITMHLGRFDLLARSYSYISAGHNPAILVDAAGGLSWLPPTGPAIGLVEGAQYSMESRTLRAGDTLVFYTDGVTEAMNPQRQMFGEERLAQTVIALRQLPAAQIVAGLRQSVASFSADQPLDDDATIVVCKVNY